MPKDNSTFAQKAALRRAVLREVVDPVILETHGGAGALYRACYSHIRRGLVFERDEEKANLLAGQRPTWSVYRADVVSALADGAGAHLAINLLDCDPYGEPWPILRAFFGSDRPFAPRLWLVVNDGLRIRLRYGMAWRTESLRAVVAQLGTDLYPIYLDVCQLLVGEIAKAAGYTLRRFRGYYAGHNDGLTHYAALLERA